MIDKSLELGNYSSVEEDADAQPLCSAEIEVRLAIADFVIRRVAGTPEGEVIFTGLIKRFENRYPHHKLLTNCLLCPEYLEPDSEYGDN